MRMDVMTSLAVDDGDAGRPVGAVVVRAHPAGGLAIEVGPADGSPILRLMLASTEAARLAAAVQAVLNGRNEEVVMVED